MLVLYGTDFKREKTGTTKECRYITLKARKGIFGALITFSRDIVSLALNKSPQVFSIKRKDKNKIKRINQKRALDIYKRP